MTITLAEAQATLSDLVHRLVPGEEMVITENDRQVATLVASSKDEQRIPRLGTQKGTVLYMAPDFDAPLDDFADYM